MKKRIFTYWQTSEDTETPMPDYLRLCMQTWERNIPALELVIINHDNLYEWIGRNYIDIDTLRTLTPMQQSDVVTYALLYEHGGVFLDADTIIFKDIFEEIDRFDEDKVYFFGYPKTKTAHLAAIFCKNPKNEIFNAYMNRVKMTLAKSTLSKEDYLPLYTFFGNWVIDPINADPIYTDLIKVMDRTEEGAILESAFLGTGKPNFDYNIFYFWKNEIQLKEVLSKIKFGLVCLHNSWTPKNYKSLTRDMIANDTKLLSKLIMYALNI